MFYGVDVLLLPYEKRFSYVFYMKNTLNSIDAAAMYYLEP